MKKVLIGLILIAVAGGAGWFFFLREKEVVGPTENKVLNPVNGILVDGEFLVITNACKVFTQTDADTLLGAPSKQSSTVAGTSESGDAQSSNCTYTMTDTEAESPVDGNVSVGFISHTAKNEAGAAVNKQQFATVPENTEPVVGYGDSAYWDARYGQFNVLKDNNWYVFTSGKIIVAERTLDDAMALADVLMSKLQ